MFYFLSKVWGECFFVKRVKKLIFLLKVFCLSDNFVFIYFIVWIVDCVVIFVCNVLIGELKIICIFDVWVVVNVMVWVKKFFLCK